MDLQTTLTVVLSLVMIAFVVGMAIWSTKTSKHEEKKYKGIPAEAEKWIQATTILFWLTIASIPMSYLIDDGNTWAGLFLMCLGATIATKGRAASIVKATFNRGSPGSTLYGKPARIKGIVFMIFGILIFFVGLCGLLIPTEADHAGQSTSEGHQ